MGSQPLAPYVPHWVLRHLDDPTAPARSGRKYSFEAAVLWADIVGSTPLAEQLTGEGPQGIEALNEVLNAVLGPLVEIAYAFGGDVLHFVGDAIVCIWPVEGATGAKVRRQTALRACAAAFEMRSTLVRMQPLETPIGPVKPAVRFGIGYGQTTLHILGEIPHHWLVDGPAVWEALRARVRAAPNQIRIAPDTARMLGAPPTPPSPDALSLPPLPQRPEPPPRVDGERLRRFVHPFLIRRVLDEVQGFAAEYRLVVPVFVRWTPPETEGGDEWLNWWIQTVQSRVAQFGGWIDNPVVDPHGYTLLIAFGAPIAHGDDTRRGVACALALREAALSEAPRFPLQIGISRGRLFTGEIGSSTRRAYTLIGDEINLASRLAERAGPWEVLTTPEVRNATSTHFTFRKMGETLLRGKHKPVLAFAVLSGLRSRPPLIRQYLLRRERLIDREQETTVLHAVIDRAMSGQAQVLTIQGEPGIGKSMLASELVRLWVGQGGTALGGEGVPFARESPYRLWRWILSSVCGITGEMGPTEQLQSLQQALMRIPPPQGEKESEERWRLRLPLLAEILGIKVEDNELTRGMRGQVRRDNIFATVTALIQAKAEEVPLLILIEDAQWADDLSLQLAAYIARNLRTSPFLLALVHRPLPFPPSLPWRQIWDLEHHTSLLLGELTPEATQAIVQDRLGGVRVPTDLATLIFDRTQGHPFFTEELVHMFRDVGGIALRGKNAVLNRRRIHHLRIPDTIAGVIQARIDQLDEACRLTLKVASVLGLTFSRQALRDIHPTSPDDESLDRLLGSLERWRLIRLEEATPERMYAFRHALTQQVVYESLPLSQRQQLHEAVARWYERRYADDLEPYYSLLAYHYGQAGQRDKELQYLLQAADRAHRASAMAEATALYERALGLLDPQKEPLRRAEVLIKLAREVHLLGEYARGEAYLEEALALYERAGDPRGVATACFEIADRLAVKDLEAALDRVRQGLEAVRGLQDTEELLIAGYVRIAQLERNRGRFREAEQALQRALRLAEAVGWREGLRRCYRALSIHYYSRGEYRKALEAGEKVLRFLESDDALIEHRLIALNNQACFAQSLGDIETALEMARTGLRLARKAGIISEQVIIASTLAGIYNHIGDWEAAEEVLQEGWRLLRRSPHPYHQVALLWEGGRTAFGRSDWDEAIRRWSQAEEASRSGAQRLYNAWLCACLATAWAEKGNLEEAQKWADEALRRAEERGQKGVLLIAWRAQGIIERMRGNWDAAEEAFRRSLRLAREVHDDVQAARTLLEYGRLLLEAGRTEDALEMLRRAEQQARALQLYPVVQAARTLIQQSREAASSPRWRE